MIMEVRNGGWGVGASEIISAIGIQYGSVVLEFKEKILNHTARQIDSPVAHQSQNNEVTIPSIHFVETAARHDVTVWQEKQTLRRDRFHSGFARMLDNQG